MKAKKLSVLGFGSMLLAMASCSNDSIMPEPNKPLEADQSFYVPIAVNGFGDNTRAGENDLPGDLGDYTTSDPYEPGKEPNFDKGEEKENKVETVCLVFYDAAGKRVSSLRVNKELGNAPIVNNSQNAIYTGVVQVDVQRGQSIPAYALAFINPSGDYGENYESFGTHSDFATLESVEKAVRTSLIDASDKFAMSNSVYYGTNPVTGQDNVRIMATPITPGQIFLTEEDAKNALEKPGTDASAVDIYVERYAAKVNFELTDIQELDIEGTKLVFNPEYWAVNAIEEESYVTKTFFGSNGSIIDFSQPAPYTTIDGLLDWTWNSPDYHRSYWGQSPSYYVARYPRVADDIMDQEGWTKGSKGDYELKYFSYNELKDNANTKLSGLARELKKNEKGTLYTRENTVSGDAMKAAAKDPLASPRASIASIVLVGYYTLKDANGVTTKIDDDEFIYVTGNKTNGYKLYKKYDDMLTYFVDNSIAMQTKEGQPFFKYTGTGEWINTDYKQYFDIIHPSKAVRENLVLDSRFVTLQLKNDAIGQLKVKVGDDFVEVSENNIVALNQLLMSAAGTARGFRGGKAYFTIPIQHLGYYRSTNEDNQKIAAGANAANFKWENVKSGDFGVVRNHVYTITASIKEGLGNGIPHPDDPIVPPTDPNEYYIGARIVVLNWAIVPTQKVDL